MPVWTTHSLSICWQVTLPQNSRFFCFCSLVLKVFVFLLVLWECSDAWNPCFALYHMLMVKELIARVIFCYAHLKQNTVESSNLLDIAHSELSTQKRTSKFIKKTTVLQYKMQWLAEQLLRDSLPWGFWILGLWCLWAVSCSSCVYHCQL